VPFIDLLSALVLFLLITAVWVQISTISASVDAKGRHAISSTPLGNIHIRVVPSGFDLSGPVHGLPSRIPRLSTGYDLDRLGAVLAQVSKRGGNLPQVAVTGEDAIDYGIIVKAIDAAKSNGFPSVAVGVN